MDIGHSGTTTTTSTSPMDIGQSGTMTTTSTSLMDNLAQRRKHSRHRWAIWHDDENIHIIDGQSVTTITTSTSLMDNKAQRWQHSHHWWTIWHNDDNIDIADGQSGTTMTTSTSTIEVSRPVAGRKYHVRIVLSFSAHPWSANENAAVMKHFSHLISIRRPSRKRECESVPMTEPALPSRSWQSIKDHVASKIRYDKIRHRK